MSEIHKVIVVGNIAGGKTVLSHSLSKRYNLPLTHVDALQFLPGMKVRPHEETQKLIDKITAQEKWLIDGFGPLDLIEKRFLMADKIVFVDLPIWQHYWWCTKRQIKSLWTPRPELPENCSETTFSHTFKLYKTLWRIHKKMRPELLKIFKRDHLKQKVVFVQNKNQWNSIFKNGLV